LNKGKFVRFSAYFKKQSIFEDALLSIFCHLINEVSAVGYSFQLAIFCIEITDASTKSSKERQCDKISAMEID